MSSLYRWKATVTYRVETHPGELSVEHLLHEMSDLHDLIERGPHWDTIIQVVVVRNTVYEPNLTVEKAATQ